MDWGIVLAGGSGTSALRLQNVPSTRLPTVAAR